MTTSTATPILEFDFVGSDWPQLVAMVGESQERLERLKEDLAEREKRIAKYASRPPLPSRPSPTHCTPSTPHSYMSSLGACPRFDSSARRASTCPKPLTRLGRA